MVIDQTESSYAGTNGEEGDVPSQVNSEELITVFRYLPDDDKLVHKNGCESMRYMSELKDYTSYLSKASPIQHDCARGNCQLVRD